LDRSKEQVRGRGKVTTSLLPIIPVPNALTQDFHADLLFSNIHARSRLKGAVAEAYQRGVPRRKTAQGAETQGPTDNERLLTVTADIHQSNSCRYYLSTKPLPAKNAGSRGRRTCSSGMLASVWQRRASADPVLQTFHVRQLTLSQTVKRNELSNELITALASARRDAALDPGVRCMVIFRREHLVFGRS
jgi:hypothetical protein